MKKSMLALAAASVFALFAHADEQAWFDAKIGSYTSWPTSTDPGVMGGAWSNTDNIELGGTAPDATLVLDTDASAPLTFTANAGTTKDLTSQAKNVTINSEVEFNPFDSAKMPEVPADAKAGLIVVTNTTENTLQYYVLAKDGSTNAWTAAAYAGVDGVKLEAPVTIAITNDVANSQFCATYTVDNVPLTVGGSELIPIYIAQGSESVSAVAYSGSGVVKSLASTYRGANVIITIPTLANASVVVSNGTEQIAAVAGAYTVQMGSVVSWAYTAAPGYVFADGVTVQTGTHTASGDTTVTLDYDTSIEAEARINQVYYTTLVNAVAAAITAGSTEVTVCKNVTLADTIAISGALSNPLAITLGNYTVSAASKSAFTVNTTGAALTIAGGTIEVTGADAIALTAGSLTIGNSDATTVIKGANGVTVAAGTFAVAGTSAYDGTLIEGTAGAGVLFTGNTGSITFSWTGKPTFKGSTKAMISSGTFGAFLDFEAGDSPRFITTQSMLEDTNLVADGTEFFVDVDTYTYIREVVATGYTVKFYKEKACEETDLFATSNNVVGVVYPPNPAPTKDGFTFRGWFYDDGVGDVEWEFDTVLEDHQDLYALWDSATVPVTGVTLDIASTNVVVGDEFTLTATVAPADATDKSVSWSVTEGDACTVANGVVTAVKAGTATITVTTTDGSKTATCTVTVADASPWTPEEQAKIISGDVPAGKEQAVKDNLDTITEKLIAAGGTGTSESMVEAWTLRAYGEGGKIPAAKLADATDAQLDLAVTYDLPIIANPQVTVAADTEAANTFVFTIKDGSDPVAVKAAAAKVQGLIQYCADLADDDFEPSTAAEISVSVDAGVIKAGFVSGPAKGFMKLSSETAK